MADPILDPAGDLYGYGKPDSVCAGPVVECLRAFAPDWFLLLVAAALFVTLVFAFRYFVRTSRSRASQSHRHSIVSPPESSP